MLNRINQFINENDEKIILTKNKLNINNYDEIYTLEDNRISLNIKGKRYLIKGNNLVLNKMQDKELLITGEVLSIEVINE